VGTNFGAGGVGGSTSPGGVSGQIQFNSVGTLGGTANLVYYTGNGAVQALGGTNSTSTSTGQLQVVGGVGVTGNVTADIFNAVNNGNGTNFKVGDDVWLGDINIANTLGIRGQQDGTQGYIRFGNTNTSSLGVSGSGPLSWGGVLNVTGNILGATASFGAINSTGFINTSGNVSAAVHTGGAVSVTGFINTSGNVSAAVHTGGAVSVTGFINTSGNVSAAVYTGGIVNVTGNIIAANINAGGVRQTTSTSAPTVATVGDQWYDSEQDTLLQYIFDGTNFFWVDVSGQTLNVNISTVQGTSLSITGNGTVGGNLTVTGFMVGRSTQALYADLAEKYAADSDYEPGIVLVFGGDAEVTQSTSSHDPTVAGVVSTNPAYLMNSGQVGASVALTGRVPCWVRGPINKGDRVVTSDIPGVAEQLDLARYQPGCIIGKSLESVEDGEVRKIEVVVGRI
jgi:hypothetical protein